MAFQPIGVGMKKDEPALLAKINQTLLAMDKAGEINQLWDKWLGPNAEFKMTRTDKVVPLSELKFTPLPCLTFRRSTQRYGVNFRVKPEVGRRAGEHPIA